MLTTPFQLVKDRPMFAFESPPGRERFANKQPHLWEQFARIYTTYNPAGSVPQACWTTMATDLGLYLLTGDHTLRIMKPNSASCINDTC